MRVAPVEAPAGLPAAAAQEQHSGQRHERAAHEERQDHRQQHVVVEDAVGLGLWAGGSQGRWARPPPAPARARPGPALTVGPPVLLSHREVRAGVAAALAAAVAMVGVGCILELGGGPGGQGLLRPARRSPPPAGSPEREWEEEPAGGGDSRRGAPGPPPPRLDRRGDLRFPQFKPGEVYPSAASPAGGPAGRAGQEACPEKGKRSGGMGKLRTSAHCRETPGALAARPGAGGGGCLSAGRRVHGSGTGAWRAEGVGPVTTQPRLRRELSLRPVLGQRRGQRRRVRSQP